MEHPVHRLVLVYRLCGVPLAALALMYVLLIAVASPGQKPSAKNSFDQLAAQAAKASEENKLEDAAGLYRRALALKPSWAEGWWSLATLDYDRDDYVHAAEAFRKVIVLQPNNGTAHAMLGLCEFELQRDAEAFKHIETGKSLGLQKNAELWHVVLFREGILLQRRGGFQAAQDTLEELCLQTGSNDNAAMILGMAMLRNREKEIPPIGSKDGDIILRVGRAQCLAGQKKYDEARPGFESVVKENPDYPNIHYAFGLFLFEIRDVGAGVEQLKQEIANNPKNVLARLRIAAAEYKQDSAAGLVYAEEAAKLDPEQPFAHMLVGLLRLEVDDYLNAIPELEVARKGLPNEAKIYAALGTAYGRAGRKQDAAQARLTFARLTEEEKRRSSASGTSEPGNSPPDQIKIGDLPTPAK
jgi:tetratricopeptide (TPR) repeat protein